MAVKDVAKSTAKKGRDALIARWRAFREESPYFQAKVGLVTAWIVVSLLTVIVVPPTPIPFIVEQRAVTFGISQKTVIIIHNQNGGDIKKATVEIRGASIDYDGAATSGTWTTKPFPLPETKTTLPSERFTNAEGLPPSFNVRVDNVRIFDGKDIVYDGPAAEPPK